MSTGDFVTYQPPLDLEKVMSANPGAEGPWNSVSLLLRDSLGELFALHVVTQENFMAAVTEFDEDPSPQLPEPNFVVPGTLDERFIHELIRGVPPDILGRFLVAQE